MSQEKHNEQIIRHLIEAINEKTPGRGPEKYIEEYFLPDATFYLGSAVFSGRDKIIDINRHLLEATPDLIYKIEDLFSCDDLVSLRWKSQGTTVKEYGDFKVGDSADQWGLSLFKFKEGRIAENWCCSEKKFFH